MVVGFKLGRRDVAQRLHQSVVVEPSYPFQRGQFDRLLGPPRPASMDHLGLVEPVDGLGQGVVGKRSMNPTLESEAEL
jgi:hypothetical protein